jgi:hypothetical protein
MNPNIEQAIQNFRAAGVRCARTERYYCGEHDLAFATEKFANAFGTLFREFALNLCPAICDAVRDKLKVTGFSVESAGRDASVDERAIAFDSGTLPDGRVSACNGDTIHTAIDHIWRRNRMDIRVGEIHKEALKNGDAYAVVWSTPSGEVTIYPQRASSCTVVYDEESPGRILWAAKYWRTPEKCTRLNIFYPDRIERYVTARECENALPEAREFVPFAGNAGDPPASSAEHEGKIKTQAAPHAGRLGTSHIAANPFGVVPVFHFGNNADIGCFGQSELTDAIPIQDGLNKSILDMLVAMEFSAYRQRWVAGIDVELDEATGKPKPPFLSGVDHLWVAPDAETRFGDFNTANLEQFLKVKDSFRIDIASVTGTPLHYFLQSPRAFASGEALRKNETRFLAKVRDRQTAFGHVWAELMSFALRLAGLGDGIELITEWEDPSPIEEREVLQNIILKQRIGISSEQALKEAGYGDVDVRRMAKD